MPEISFNVPGIPIPKARPRFTRYGHCFTPAKTENYEAQLKYCFLKAIGRIWKPLDCPVSLSIIASFIMPKSAPKADRIARQRPKVTKPDLDNVIKSVCDGLNGLAWIDDSQIWQILSASKIETIGMPGLSITIKY